jgi:hypothetical protein
MPDSVTRMEIAEAVRIAFNGSGAARADILAAASAAQVRPAVIDVLSSLPEIRFRELRDLWTELSHLPVGA